MTGENLPEKLACKLESERQERAGHGHMKRKSVPGRGTSKFKGSESGPCLGCWGNGEKSSLQGALVLWELTEGMLESNRYMGH